MGTDPVVINRPAVVAEVRAVFDRYETALAVGVTGRQLDASEILAWRRAHRTVPAGRRLRDTTVLSIDHDTAVVTTLFDHPGRGTEGMQSQVWVRFAEGWRIVTAHVSEIPAPR